MAIEEYDPGRYVSQGGYEAFIPSTVHRGWTWKDPRIGTLLEDATRAVGELNAFSRLVPDVDLFLRLHILKEANASSRIEGTRTEMDEAVRPREEIPPEKRDDWEEVQNYVAAMGEAIERLETLPLSSRLLRETHRTLMKGVRGEHKNPGAFRKSQNWIGGATLEDALFVPPPAHRVDDLMGDLEKFWHDEDLQVPHLLRIGISHYQFETIHPFLDGNGRVGRLLITLYLISKGMLEEPTLYISSYLDRERDAYFESLANVRAASDLGQCIRFFLVAIRDTARESADTLERVRDLRERVENRVTDEMGRRAGNGRKLLALLYRRPFVAAAEVADDLKVTDRTARNLLSDFEEMGLIHETTGKQRNRRYLFEEYFRLFAD